VVIATQHKRDHLWLKKALEGNAAYVALIASHHRAKLVLAYLRAGDVSEEKIATVYAPAGLHLGASTPEEIALSVMSQMVALRRGGQVHRMPGEENGLSGRGFDVDAVIRRCEAEILP
jgi:xanthine dehydrogenase accessory factor